MKKLVNRNYIEEMIRDDRQLSDYCHVELLNPIKGIYGIVRDIDWKILVVGKELKGYLGDIIYPQYNGEKYVAGDFQLNSDRHGVICKWKGK